MSSSRKSPPFGIAQIGKAFRNEITPRFFVFRSREFEQMELEFFCPPDQAAEWFEHFREVRFQWHLDMGIRPEKLRWHEHGPDELAHYCRRAYDIEFEFPFGWQEFEGLHDRSDYDLTRHRDHSGKDQSYTDPETKERYLPYVIETSLGVDRCMLALLANGYVEDEVGGEKRTLLRLSPAVAPVKAAVLPLSKKLAEPAQRIAADLQRRFNTAVDLTGNIGRRYRRQDEIGTPYCVTYDFESEHKTTKASINRGAEIAGFREALRYGVESGAILDSTETETSRKFDEVREREGLGAAIRWRESQFE